ncbi:XRE family transcriptional regulator [Muribaculaceae bacterium Isolate-113 (HZI)]|nr:XRE family transcriptional regulator [Muribaculaceae bacterium Isolate-114 (HZI)]ROT22728.1 XRE family transcriptional regulator [Muribaculaceae bacterium Isolate-113 (HZI)]
MHIGKKIKELAEKKKLTAPKLGKALGITKQAIYDLYDKEDVNTKLLKQIADALGVPVAIFFDEEGTKTDIQEQIGGRQNIQNKAGRDVVNGMNMAEHDELIRLREEVKSLKAKIKDKEDEIQGVKDGRDRELAGKDAIIAELRASLDRVQKMNDYLMGQK